MFCLKRLRIDTLGGNYGALDTFLPNGAFVRAIYRRSRTEQAIDRSKGPAYSLRELVVSSRT